MPKPRLRTGQYSLRALFLLTTVVAAFLSFPAVRLQRHAAEERALKEVVALGGSASIDKCSCRRFPSIDSCSWMHSCRWYKLFAGSDEGSGGLDFGDHVGEVCFLPPGVFCLHNEVDEDAPLTDKELLQLGPHLSRLEHLRRLVIVSAKVSDRGVSVIRRLQQLEQLELCQTQITDVGLAHLTALRRLRFLNLHGSNCVTSDGLEELKKALPDLCIEGVTRSPGPGASR